jgi:hypothetical protein
VVRPGHSWQTCANRATLKIRPTRSLGLYRDEMDHPGSDDKGLAELSVLKKRQLGEDVGTMRRPVWLGETYKDLARGV